MKGVSGMKWIIFGAAAFIVWLLLSAVFPQIKSVPSLGIVGLLGAVALVGGVLALLKYLHVFDAYPFAANGVTVGVLLVLGLVLGGFIPALSGLAGGLAPAGTIAPAGTVQTVPAAATGSTLSACAASVDPTIRGTSATVTLNAYDVEAANPYSAAVSAGTVYIYKAATIADGNTDNFVTSTSSTIANGVTGFKTGDVISLAGGNTTASSALGNYYVEAVDGICLNGQQNSVNLKAHQWSSEATLQTVVYDSTSSVALGAGTVGIDYTAAQGANSEQPYYWRAKVNGANRAYWLGGVGFAVFNNISSAYPGGNSAGLFTQVPTPQFLRDLNFPTATEAQGGGANNMTRSYAVYRLKSPVLLHQFDEFKFQFNVKASGNDPVGAANTTTWSGVDGIMLDQAYARGADGKMYLDLNDHAITGSEANVGVAETTTSPNGVTSGFMLTIT